VKRKDEGMTTAKEISVRMEMEMVKISHLRNQIEKSVNQPMAFKLISRKVCAKRARKLRRRGENVQFYTHTSTGRAVYGWMPRLKIKP